MYSYRIRYDDEKDWPHQILNHRTVTGMSERKGASLQGVQLHLQNESGKYLAHGDSAEEKLNVDLVVVASGYRRNAHEDMLRELEQLRPAHSTRSAKWEVNRDYSVKFADGVVDSDAGVWLQGCNEGTHGLSDTLLSILATRGGEMVENIFGDR